MKTSKSLQLLDAQNNNISPAVGVDSIFYEKTDEQSGIVNRYPLSFIGTIKNTSTTTNSSNNTKPEFFSSVTVTPSQKSTDGNNVFDISILSYDANIVKNWIVGATDSRVAGLSKDVSTNKNNISKQSDTITSISNALATNVVRHYFNSSDKHTNSPHQRSGMRLATEAVKTTENGVTFVNGVLHGFPTLGMMETDENTTWYNNYANSSYLSLGIGCNVSIGWDKTNNKYTDEQKYWGTNYYYTKLSKDQLFDASLYLNYDNASSNGGLNGYGPNNPSNSFAEGTNIDSIKDTGQYWKIFRAPTIQIDETKRFPYLPGFTPKWLRGGASYLLALAADDPSAGVDPKKPLNNDTPIHMAWINSSALNNTAASKQLISDFWNSSIATYSINTKTVKSYVDTSINNAINKIRGEINSSINASIGSLGVKTVKEYIDSSITNSLPRLKVWSPSSETTSTTPSTYYLLSTKSHSVNATNLKNDLWVCQDNLWYIQQNNLFGGNFYSTSDENLKHDIKDISGVDLPFEPKTFKWNDNNKQTYGFVAQEIEKECPELVSNGNDGYKRVNYDAALALLVGKLINKIQKLEARVSELEKK